MKELPSYTSPAGTRITVDLARGAKIVSLTDLTGREWLTQTTRSAARPVASFGDAEMAGWDECAPTITACNVNGRHLPDHGDLWNRQWHGDVRHSVVCGTSLPYRMTRNVGSSPDGGLRLDYTVEATEEPLPFLWAAHPQFVAPPGTIVALDPAVQSVIDVESDDWPTIPWSDRVHAIDTVSEHAARKVYVHPDTSVSSASLVHRDGSRLTLSWSAPCRYLGIWFDNGRYADESVIALEPSLGFADSLATAVACRAVPRIEPGVPLQWHLDVAVDRVPDQSS